MMNFQTARRNMVDCQVRPDGVIMPELIEAYRTVPREIFVPETSQNVAYLDEDLNLGHGRFILAPSVHARMIEALALKKGDAVLDIGGTGGYSAAILSSLASEIVALDCDALSVKAWDTLKINNVRAVRGDLKKGVSDGTSYDAVLVNGSVDNIPETWFKHIKLGGSLVAIIRQTGDQTGHVTLFKNTGKGNISSRRLFEAGCPYLPGMQPEPVFSF